LLDLVNGSGVLRMIGQAKRRFDFGRLGHPERGIVEDGRRERAKIRAGFSRAAIISFVESISSGELKRP
jgi:hypothetical protein